MDPQVRAFLDAAALADLPSIADLSPAENRDRFNGLTDLFLPRIDVASVRDAKTPQGVPFRLYRPTRDPAEVLPVVLYIHGGGWVVGNVETHDTLCRHLAAEGQVAVASVDYRLAPEHPFPIPLQDCQSALQHLAAEAGALGLDPARLAVAGDSAGGNLAAALAIKAREEHGPPIRLQLLLYPVIDAACNTESYAAFAEDHGLTRAEMQWFWRHYLGPEDGANPVASLNRTEDLRGLPPARILTAEYDVLRDEAEAYAAQLKAAGVPVECKRLDGLIHGFFHFCGAMDRGRESVLETARWLGRELRT